MGNINRLIIREYNCSVNHKFTNILDNKKPI